MIVGPVFTREAVTAPRRVRLYLARTTYVAALWLLVCTAWMVFTGTQMVRNVGDMARFGAAVFHILAPLQLAVMVFFSALSAASAVCQEKDRRTLDLLLLTRMNNCELVLGKLLASMLQVLVLIAASLPLFALMALFGGVGFDQIGRTFLVTLASALAAGSFGSLLGLWRDKTFQTLALTALGLAFWIGIWIALPHIWPHAQALGIGLQTWAVMFSPWDAVLDAARPGIFAPHELGPLEVLGSPITGFVLFALLAAALMNVWAMLRVRAWNPSQETDRRRAPQEEPESIFGLNEAPTLEAVRAERRRAAVQPGAAPRAQRPVWDNPILWREVRTWAYGRKVVLIRLAYGVLAALCLAALLGLHGGGAQLAAGAGALVMMALCVISLAIINVQAVTAVTNERDARALDLLLVTDLTPGEFLFGKLAGIAYNTKEMVLVPIALAVVLRLLGALSTEHLVLLVGGLVVLQAFVAMLGIHCGMAYSNSRTAIATSLGTVFFLFVGIATCMRIMVAFGGQFQAQLAPFLTFMLGGGVALYVALGIRNPSPAITLASLGCPFATFYAITSFLLHNYLTVFLTLAVTYGFATAAMLIPALYEFDVATGRTTEAAE